jgi:hypothetical protein
VMGTMIFTVGVIVALVNIISGRKKA